MSYCRSTAYTRSSCPSAFETFQPAVVPDPQSFSRAAVCSLWSPVSNFAQPPRVQVGKILLTQQGRMDTAERSSLVLAERFGGRVVGQLAQP